MEKLLAVSTSLLENTGDYFPDLSMSVAPSEKNKLEFILEESIGSDDPGFNL